MEQHKNIEDESTTVEELKEIGRNYYGLAWPANTRKDKIVTEIKAAMNEEEDLRSTKDDLEKKNTAATQAAAKEKEKETAPAEREHPANVDKDWGKKAAPKVNRALWPVITLNKTETDIQPLPISVNGVQYTVPRGVEVAVPPWVLHVLENAMEEKYTKEGQSLGHMPAHAFHVVRNPLAAR